MPPRTPTTRWADRRPRSRGHARQGRLGQQPFARRAAPAASVATAAIGVDDRQRIAGVAVHHLLAGHEIEGDSERRGWRSGPVVDVLGNEPTRGALATGARHGLRRFGRTVSGSRSSQNGPIRSQAPQARSARIAPIPRRCAPKRIPRSPTSCSIAPPGANPPAFSSSASLTPGTSISVAARSPPTANMAGVGITTTRSSKR